ncbi:hypothetical protein LIA77_01802 [Sarocladium implicatum]|nr:hypothetical protein LIA77_01802 [Sarocladium implicatum]
MLDRSNVTCFRVAISTLSVLRCSNCASLANYAYSKARRFTGNRENTKPKKGILKQAMGLRQEAFAVVLVLTRYCELPYRLAPLNDQDYLRILAIDLTGNPVERRTPFMRTFADL